MAIVLALYAIIGVTFFDEEVCMCLCTWTCVFCGQVESLSCRCIWSEAVTVFIDVNCAQHFSGQIFRHSHCLFHLRHLPLSRPINLSTPTSYRLFSFLSDFMLADFNVAGNTGTGARTIWQSVTRDHLHVSYRCRRDLDWWHAHRQVISCCVNSSSPHFCAFSHWNLSSMPGADMIVIPSQMLHLPHSLHMLYLPQFQASMYAWFSQIALEPNA